MGSEVPTMPSVMSGNNSKSVPPFWYKGIIEEHIALPLMSRSFTMELFTKIFAGFCMFSMLLTVAYFLFGCWYLNRNGHDDLVKIFIASAAMQLTWKVIMMATVVTGVFLVGVGYLVKSYTSWLSFYTPVCCLYLATVMTYFLWVYTESKNLGDGPVTGS